MDILTHALIGLVAAGPLIVEQPELAAGMVAGSVVPDLDVVARFFGKRAMLRAHQTVSHSLLVLAVIAGVLALLPVPGAGFALGFFAGAALHVMMDYSNTLGVTLLWPLVRRRLQVGWVFFLDAFASTVTVAALVLTIRQFVDLGNVSPVIALTMAVVLTCYWGFKGWLITLAKRQAGTAAVSIIPSALLPWHFWVCSRAGTVITVELLNVWNRSRHRVAEHPVLDDQAEPLLRDLPEWRLMRELSPAYHVIQMEPAGTGRIIGCRDLRIRNFGSRYGDLEIEVAADGTLSKTTFHV